MLGKDFVFKFNVRSVSVVEQLCLILVCVYQRESLFCFVLLVDNLFSAFLFGLC